WESTRPGRRRSRRPGTVGPPSISAPQPIPASRMNPGNEDELMLEKTSSPPQQPLAQDADAEGRGEQEPADHSPLPPELLGRTDVAGQTADDGKARVFPSQGCGADLQFHIGQ